MNTLTNLNQELFTELAPTESANLQRGGNFETYVNFDDTFNTRDFNVSSGGTVRLASFTESASTNLNFNAVLLDSDNQEALKSVDVGNGNAFWKDLKKGNYKIQLRDKKDGIDVSGLLKLEYT
ncbi:MAG: hypothetical protein RLZZ535_3024 [Cyanobacteriota bacterium]|jgi:hypothetical protein